MKAKHVIDCHPEQRKCFRFIDRVLVAAMLLSITCLCANAAGDDQVTPAPLKGKVQRTEKAALEGLKSMGDALHKLKRSSAELFAECTRHDVELIDEPDMIGSTVIDIPVSFDLGMTLPPRKKWVEFYMGQMEQLIPLVQDEYIGIRIPDDKESLAEPYMNEIREWMKDIDFHYNKLAALAKAQPYDGQHMSSECQGIDSDVKKIHEDEKRLYHVVKEKEKASVK